MDESIVTVDSSNGLVESVATRCPRCGVPTRQSKLLRVGRSSLVRLCKTCNDNQVSERDLHAVTDTRWCYMCRSHKPNSAFYKSYLGHLLPPCTDCLEKKRRAQEDERVTKRNNMFIVPTPIVPTARQAVDTGQVRSDRVLSVLGLALTELDELERDQLVRLLQAW